MPPPLAFVRPPPGSFNRAISSHPQHGTINPTRALNQHRGYVDALKQAGAEVLVLEALGTFPDSVFIEDNALILEGTAYLCNAAAPTRQGEAKLLKTVLEKFLPVQPLPPEILADGGDFLVTDDNVFIGQSERTGRVAVDYFRNRLKQTVIPVPVEGALHLKTAACWLGEDLFILNSPAVGSEAFKNFKCIIVPEEEAYAANCLRIHETVLLPAGFPKVQKQIEDTGLTVIPVEMSEFEKADGGITCLSLILPG